MRCAAALSTHPVPSYAAGEVLGGILECGNEAPDFALVLLSPPLAGAAEDIANAIRTVLSPTDFAVVLSSGVVAAGTEVLRGPALAIWACWAESGESVERVCLIENPVSDGGSSFEHLATSDAVVVLFDSSYERETDLLGQIVEQLPDVELIGGLLSAVSGPAQIIDAHNSPQPALAVAFRNTSLRQCVGYGSEPLSSPFHVTQTVGTMLCEIDGESALGRVHELLRGLDPAIREQSARDLAIALIDPNSGKLIDVVRVLGADSTTGSLALSHEIPHSSLCEFHRQERHSARPGLEAALRGPRSNGALLFCSEPLTPESEREGIADVGIVTEELGTSAFAGLHLASVLGPRSGHMEFLAEPMSAVIFGQMHN